MKLSTQFAKIALIALAIVPILSCNKQSAKQVTPALPKGANEQVAIRYIDEDSLLANYNLAKDLNEAMLRRSNQYDAAQQQRSSEIQKFGSEVQTKYKNNGYLTEESFNADQAKLQKMQSDAQTYLGKMQHDIQSEMQQNQIMLNDSINNFLKQYNKSKGYDVILRKTATFYIDPKFNITDEVVEGLNKRYTKVSSK
ncbi:MAG: OmpH family outer membrane protein [Muribaculaceae bacterium]|jgi:outer membrane protein|nr:OmpH family outer membrane protein [Muribaculaceae bacterium]